MSGEKRHELKDLNERAWLGEEIFNPTKKLDSSLKKNIAFSKKIKVSLNVNQGKQILNEIETLTLSKYLSEITQSLYEGLVKVSKAEDVVITAEIISKLHQRFNVNFTPRLLVLILLGLTDEFNVDEPLDYLTRKRNLLHLLFELTVVGISRTIKDIEKQLLPDAILKRFSDRVKVKDLIVIVYLKILLQQEINSGYFLGSFASIMNIYHPLIKEYLPDAQQQRFHSLFTAYKDHNVKILIEKNKKLNSVITAINKSAAKYGEVFEDKAEELQEVKDQHDYFYENTKILCDTLNDDFPIITVVESNLDKFEASSALELNSTEGLNVWESIVEEKFYTVIPTLDSLDLTGYKKLEKRYIHKSEGEKVGLFLEDLSECTETNLECMVALYNNLNLDNKATRHRLFKYFTESGTKTSYKYYAKFLKINYENLASLTDDISDFLDLRLKAQLKSDKLSFKFIYFYIELIKFKLMSKYKIFHKINFLIKNISDSNNVDILTVIFENCGAILLYDEDYKESMHAALKSIKEFKSSPTIPQKTKLALSNLLLVIDSSKQKLRKLNEEVQYTPEQEFIIKLIRFELNYKTLSEITEILKTIDLCHPLYKDLIVELYTDFKLANVVNYPHMVLLLRGITANKRLESKFGFIATRIIDETIEHIFHGIELNDYRMNKERIALMKLIAVLYNKRFLNFLFIIDLCFRIVYAGHVNNVIVPNDYDNNVDGPTDLFKIQMIVTLLIDMDMENMTGSLNSNSRNARRKKMYMRRRLYEFITFFQFYVFCKQSLSVELEFRISELFEKLSKIDILRLENIQEAIMELKRLMAAKESRSTNELEEQVKEGEEEEIEGEDELSDNGVELQFSEEEENGEDEGEEEDEEEEEEEEDEEGEEEEDEDEEDEEEEAEEDDEEDEEEEEEEEEESEEDDDDEDEEEDDDEEEDNIEKKFEEDMEKEFQNLVLESYSTKIPAKTENTITIPQVKPERFALLVKRGKTVETKEININDEKVIEKSLKLKEERKTINKRILNLVSNMQE